MTALLNLSPVLLAIACYALAGLFQADSTTHEGLTALAGLLAGMAIPRLGDVFRSSKSARPAVTTLLNLSPVLLAIACYVLAGIFEADSSTREGLTALAGVLAGMAIPRLGDMFRSSQAEQPTASEAKSERLGE